MSAVVGNVMGNTRIIVALVLPWVLVSSIACKDESGPVAQLASGDLVHVVSANRGHEVVVEKGGELATVRLVGIYTFPISVMEKNEITVYARNAKGFVERELKGRTVNIILERQEPDPRGRYLGFIEEQGRDFNQRLIETGNAVLYTEFPFSREPAYAKADAEARKWVRGMWGGAASRKRLEALRRTWASVRLHETGVPVIDPLMQAGQE